MICYSVINMASTHNVLVIFSLLSVCVLSCYGLEQEETKAIKELKPRQARFFGNVLGLLLSNYDYDYSGGYNCPINACPPWRCQQDSAVIHGYCCGCARQSDLFNLFGSNQITRGPHKKFYCPSRGCPGWSCQDDSSIIHGYCCGCAHPGDNVPFVTCRPDLRCPLSSEPLCSDYNFMMDCCCTGP